jgi:uncharacterized spore protein YtfJ
MTVEQILERTGEHLGVRRVFGEPVEHDGVVLVPVAVAIGGGGGGAGPEGQGTGGGLGGVVRGIGAYVISERRVRFVPAVDTTALAALGVVGLGLLLRSRRGR